MMNLFLEVDVIPALAHEFPLTVNLLVDGYVVPSLLDESLWSSVYEDVSSDVICDVTGSGHLNRVRSK